MQHEGEDQHHAEDLVHLAEGGGADVEEEGDARDEGNEEEARDEGRGIAVQDVRHDGLLSAGFRGAWVCCEVKTEEGAEFRR